MAANTGTRVDLVPVHLIDSVWPMVTYGLEHACRRTGGDITSDYLWSETRSGGAFLLVAVDGERIVGAAVVRIEKWTSGRKCRLMCLYGEKMSEWGEAMLERIETIARAGQATSIVADGRLGWSRRYPKARVLRKTFEMDIRT